MLASSETNMREKKSETDFGSVSNRSLGVGNGKEK